MKKEEKKRSVAALLTVKTPGLKGIQQRKKCKDLPKHVYVHCSSRMIAKKFLTDAEKEGFAFGDGMKPTDKDPDDIYAIKNDFTINYTGFWPHAALGHLGGNIVWIEYEKYLSGDKDFQSVERHIWEE